MTGIDGRKRLAKPKTFNATLIDVYKFDVRFRVLFIARTSKTRLIPGHTTTSTALTRPRA